MYKDIVKSISIEEYLNNKYKVYAHKKEEKYETLDEHISLCEKYFINIVEDKELEHIFENFKDVFLSEHNKEVKDLFVKMLVSIIKFHDIGKINPLFQKAKMDNDFKIKEIEHRNDKKHSIISSFIYMDIYLEQILKTTKNKKDIEVLIKFMFVNAHIISRHHSGFNNVSEFREKIFKGIDDEEEVSNLESYRELYGYIYKDGKLTDKKLKTIRKVINKYDEELKDNVEKVKSLYVYERLMLSLLIASDFYATSEFMSGLEIKDFGSIKDVEEFYKDYKNSDIYKFIRKYEETEYDNKKDLNKVTDINILRDELFLDAERKLKSNYEKNIFYLEAPTGSGKSNVANNIAFKLLELDKRKRKIFYVYPFNTLVEQNLKNFKKIYKKTPEVINNIAVINSLYEIKCKREEREKREEEEFESYEKALLNRQFLNYPMILTTHVSMFRYLFGTSKEDVFPVYQLANSVIVLDEIQSYKNIIWGEIIEFLHSYSKLLNIKVIIMSATLPNLDYLIKDCTNNTLRLIDNREKYFINPIFKNRVKVNFDLIESENFNDEIVNLILKYDKQGKKVLIEFIKKTSAYEFYKMLLEKREFGEIASKVLLMTGDDNLLEREMVLDEIGNLDACILVATQVIEAGVDIDMDIGFKDISLFDNEEQFLGRINRSCLKEDCIVYFFNKDNSDLIYKGDVRINEDLTLINKKMRRMLEEKFFGEYYGEVLPRIDKITSNENKYNRKKFFNEDVLKLNFNDIEKKMELIDENNNDMSVYLSRVIKTKDEILDGKEIWDEYKSLLRNNKMEYAEQRIKLSQVRAKMNNFIYKVKRSDISYNDSIGELIMIEDGEKYFKDGKLDKNKFESSVGELFI